MQESVVNLNGAPTKVITWGKHIGEPLNEKSKDIIICIPGNPGTTGYYALFLQTIFEKIGFPIWLIGHSGHEIVNGQQNKKSDIDYSLNGQILHKVEFIKQYVPKDARIHFLGHSIGTYVILELLKYEEIKARVVKSYLLFPTFEHMRITPNGKWLMAIMPFVPIIIFFSYIFSILPVIIQSCLISIYLAVTGVDPRHKETIMKFVHPFVLQNVFLMAKEEMFDVLERNNSVINANKQKLKFYYGATDGWTPFRYYEKMKKDYPEADVELCVNHFDHAFVLKQSEGVGKMVAKWMHNV